MSVYFKFLSYMFVIELIFFFSFFLDTTKTHVQLQSLTYFTQIFNGERIGKKKNDKI